MGFNFRHGDRAQPALLPPDVRDWLPEGHLAWMVLDVVEGLDLSAFYARYRLDGRGGTAYDPVAMLGVLLYAYCVGERSSRRIERRLVEDVAFRVVAGNLTPDHATVARFRAAHEDAIAGLFTQVLAVCAEAGMVRVGLVALDGTKMAAAASKEANMCDERLRRAIEAEARRILDEAKAVDAAEDALYGDARGDELPPELAERSSRLRRLRAAKERLDAAQRERDAANAERSAQREADAAAGRRPRGRKPKAQPPEQKPLLVNGTDPESRLQKIRGGFIQGFNAQAAATEEQIIVAAELFASGNDCELLDLVLAAAAANLTAAGIDDEIGIGLADAGYYSADNASRTGGPEMLIATGKARNLPTESVPPPPDRMAEANQAEAELVARRRRAFERVAAGELTLGEAAGELSLSYAGTKSLWRGYRHHGDDALIRQRRGNGEGAHPRHRSVTTTRLTMEARLSTEAGRALYRRRGEIIEPVFGQIKDPRGIRRFQRRGLNACASEWKLITATHNLLKLWRANTANTALTA